VNIWKMIGTLIVAIGLMESLVGKEVTAPDGASLGLAADIEVDLDLNKVWVVVKNEWRWSTIPGEQVVGLAERAILLEG